MCPCSRGSVAYRRSPGGAKAATAGRYTPWCQGAHCATNAKTVGFRPHMVPFFSHHPGMVSLALSAGVLEIYGSSAVPHCSALSRVSPQWGEAGTDPPAAALLRGCMSTNELDKLMLSVQNNKSSFFVEQIPNIFTVGVSEYADSFDRISLYSACCANSPVKLVRVGSGPCLAGLRTRWPFASVLLIEVRPRDLVRLRVRTLVCGCTSPLKIRPSCGP